MYNRDNNSYIAGLWKKQLDISNRMCKLFLAFRDRYITPDEYFSEYKILSNQLDYYYQEEDRLLNSEE